MGSLVRFIGAGEGEANVSERQPVGSIEEPDIDVSEQRFQLFVDSVQDYGIFMLDPGGHIASWNRGAERIKGYTMEEAVGQHFSIFYGEEDRATERPMEELRVARREGRYEEEGWRYRKDGGRFWAHVTITAVRSEDGTLVGFGKVTRDLTERRETELEVRAAKERAEAASQAKSDFMAAMSHELRTPLNAIIGYTDLLDGGVAGPVTESQAVHLERIRAASGHLLLQIEQILSLAKIEAGREEVELQPVDATELAGSVITLIGPVAEGKGLAIKLDVPAEDLSLVTDPGKVRQILLNLMSNAAKFTDEGELGIRVRAVGDTSIRFQVWDTGMGIAEEDRERIFDRFTQVDQSSTRRQGGTGLGLSISRELAHLLGGELKVEDAPGPGSTFTLELPARGTAVRGQVH